MIDALTRLLFAALLDGGDAGAPRPTSAIAQAQGAETADDDVAKRALAMLAEIQAKKIDRTQLSPTLSDDYTPTVVANVSRTIPAGAPSRFELLRKNGSDGATTYVFRAWWNSGSLDYTFGFDDATKAIVKLYFRPGPPT